MQLDNPHSAALGIKIVGQKNAIFEKQSGEVVENKGYGYMNSQKQTGKQSGEVVENTYLWKKQTGTNRKTKLPILLKILDGRKRSGDN